jgi:hypothetical protein
VVLVLAVWAVGDFILTIFLGALFQTGWPKVVRVGLSFSLGAVAYWVVFSLVRVNAAKGGHHDAS